jgi:hypothetical protein
MVTMKLLVQSWSVEFEIVDDFNLFVGGVDSTFHLPKTPFFKTASHLPINTSLTNIYSLPKTLFMKNSHENLFFLHKFPPKHKRNLLCHSIAKKKSAETLKTVRWH